MPVKKTPTCVKKKKTPRETKYSTREKIQKLCPWKKKSVREKNRKKCAWKTLSAREKIQKTKKIGFHGHFFFSREKKNTAGAPYILHTGPSTSTDIDEPF